MLGPVVTGLKGWMNRLTTFQRRSKAQLVNYFVRGRQNVNTVSKATGEERRLSVKNLSVTLSFEGETESKI